MLACGALKNTVETRGLCSSLPVLLLSIPIPTGALCFLPSRFETVLASAGIWNAPETPLRRFRFKKVLRPCYPAWPAARALAIGHAPRQPWAGGWPVCGYFVADQSFPAHVQRLSSIPARCCIGVSLDACPRFFFHVAEFTSGTCLPARRVRDGRSAFPASCPCRIVSPAGFVLSAPRRAASSTNQSGRADRLDWAYGPACRGRGGRASAIHGGCHAPCLSHRPTGEVVGAFWSSGQMLGSFLAGLFFPPLRGEGEKRLSHFAHQTIEQIKRWTKKANRAIRENTMAAPYIPATDSGFQSWLLNFSTLITAAPTDYGLVSGDAVIIAAQETAYSAALLLATDPSSRTPATVAAKDAAKSSALAVVRPYAMQINANSGVTDLDRAALGLTIRKTVPTPVPAPTAVPGLAFVAATPLATQLRSFDTATPTTKAKPYGASAIEIFAAVGTTAAVDPTQASFVNQFSKSPLTLDWDSGQVGKIAVVWARYTTKGSYAGPALKGPWSAPLQFNIL